MPPFLKGNSGVGIIIAYPKEHCCEWCVVLSSNFFSCETTHVDLGNARNNVIFYEVT